MQKQLAAQMMDNHRRHPMRQWTPEEVEDIIKNTNVKVFVPNPSMKVS